MPACFQSAFCCWASQQSPVDDGPSSLPSSPSACTHACTCTGSRTNDSCCQHGRHSITGTSKHGLLHHSLDIAMTDIPPSPSSTHNDSVLARIARSSAASSPASSIRHLTPASPAPVVTRKSSTTFVLTTPSAYNTSPSSTCNPTSTLTTAAVSTGVGATGATPALSVGGKSPPKRFSLQKYYYTRNTMSKPSSAAATATTLPSIPSTSSFVKTGNTTATGPTPVPSFSGPRSSLYQSTSLSGTTGSALSTTIAAASSDIASSNSSSSPKLTPYPHPYHRASSSSPKLSAHHRPSSPDLHQSSPPPSPLSIVQPRLSRESRRSNVNINNGSSSSNNNVHAPPTLHIQRASMSGSSIVDQGSSTTATAGAPQPSLSTSSLASSSSSSPWHSSPPSPSSACPLRPPMLAGQLNNNTVVNNNIDMREQPHPFGRTTTEDSILPASFTTPELSIGVRLSVPPLAVTAPSPPTPSSTMVGGDNSGDAHQQQQEPNGSSPLQVPTLSLPGKKPSLPALQTSSSAKRSTSTTSVSTNYSVSSSTTPTSTSSSPTVSANISSPLRSALVPYPASPITPQELLNLMKNHASSGRGRPLVLDVRPHPEFYPLSIAHSININLPTLLLRRYRRGGAVSSFALESFITMPSDKDLYHAIQDEWRAKTAVATNSCKENSGDVLNEMNNSEVAHDVVVLDHDMRAGDEEYGRAATPAWTLVSVLERGGGNLSGPIRLWYLQGGFEAFQTWNTDERYLAQYGECMLDDDPFEASKLNGGHGLGLSTPAGSTLGGALVNTPLREEDEENVDMASLPTAHPLQPSIHPLQQDVEMKEAPTTVDANTAKIVARAVSMSGAATPRQRITSGAPARRESLFSLNTKSLQRPAGLARAQTIGVSPLNIKTTNLQAPPLPKANWLTVPTGGNSTNNNNNNTHLAANNNNNSGSNNGSPNAPSPAMSLGNASMDIAHSATLSDHWSASSNSLAGGIENGPTLARSLTNKTSVSSLATLASNGGSGHYGNHTHPYHHHHHGGSDRIDEQAEEEDDPANSKPRDGRNGYFDDQHEDSSMAYYHHYGEDSEGAENDGEQEVSCILPSFLYLGPEVVTEEQAQELERLGVKRVLNLARECEDAVVANRPGMAYYKIGLQDHVEADVSAGLLQAVDIIASSPDSPIYVHCKAGKSRSVTATIAYMITHLRWPLKKSYDHVLERRRCMCPNIGFVAELMRIEERTLGPQQERVGMNNNGGNGGSGDLVRAGSLNSILSLSTSTGSPRMLNHKSSSMTMKSSFGSAVAEMGFHHPQGGYQLTDKPVPLQTDFHQPSFASTKLMAMEGSGERQATRFTFENLHQLPSMRAAATVGGGWMDEDDFRGGIRSAME
ncbi:hypothetical protein BGW42_005806 [Actinomortierella wolfii]|nr:hypothetical protein BGW42_005806 [Actinomortierella wolfii]